MDHSYNPQPPRTRMMEAPLPELDLHGYQKSQAIRRVTDFLDQYNNISNNNLHNNNNAACWVRIITGTGSHSIDGPVLRTAVQKLFERREMDFQLETPGSFVVDATSGAQLFYENPGQMVGTKVVVVDRDDGSSDQIFRRDAPGAGASAGDLMSYPLSATLAPSSSAPVAAPRHLQDQFRHSVSLSPPGERSSTATTANSSFSSISNNNNGGGAGYGSNNGSIHGYNHPNNIDSHVVMVNRENRERKPPANLFPVQAPHPYVGGHQPMSSAQRSVSFTDDLDYRVRTGTAPAAALPPGTIVRRPPPIMNGISHQQQQLWEDEDRRAKALSMGFDSVEAMLRHQNEEIRVIDQARYDSIEEERRRREQQEYEERALEEALRISLEQRKEEESQEEELLRKAMELSQQEIERRRQLEEEERRKQEEEYRKALELSQSMKERETATEEELMRKILQLSQEEEEAAKRRKQEEEEEILNNALRLSLKLKEEEAAKEQEMLRKVMEMSEQEQEEKKQSYGDEDEDEEEMLRKIMELSAKQDEEQKRLEEEYMKQVMEQSTKEAYGSSNNANARSFASRMESVSDFDNEEDDPELLEALKRSTRYR